MGSLSWGFTGSDGVIFVTGLRFEGAWCLSSLLGFGMLRFGSRFVDVEKGSQYVGVHMFKGEKEKLMSHAVSLLRYVLTPLWSKHTLRTWTLRAFAVHQSFNQSTNRINQSVRV